MNEFFKSELVRGDIQEMASMQEYCMRCMSMFNVLSPRKKLDYFNILERLIEKQKIFYARLSLSEDEEAKDMAKSMRDAAIMLGAPPDEDIVSMFDQLVERVGAMREKVQSEMAEEG